MNTPIDIDCTNSLVVLEFLKERLEGLAITCFEELVCIYEGHPSMEGTVQPDALAVYVGLHVFVLRFTVVILERKGGTWDAIICEAGERRGRAIVHDIEATNTVVIMVVDEEFRKIARLVLGGNTECYVFVCVCAGRFGFAIVIEGI
jgi:hypothetical protein